MEYTALIKSNINYNCPYYSSSYTQVKKYAKSQVHPFYYEPMNVHVQSYVEIYKNDHLIETVYNDYTTKVLLIQRWWKKTFLKRKIARFLIKQKIVGVKVSEKEKINNILKNKGQFLYYSLGYQYYLEQD